MGIKAKIALLILLVAGVIAVIVWDKNTAAIPSRTAGGGNKDGLVTRVNNRDEIPNPDNTAPPPGDNNTTREPIADRTPVRGPFRPVVSEPTDENMADIVITPPKSRPSLEEVPPKEELPGRLEHTTVTTKPEERTQPERPGVTEPRVTPPAKTTPDSYVVQSGDSLWRIAETVYGSGKKWRMILDANRDKLSEGDALKVGWVLTIPKDEEPTPVERTTRIEEPTTAPEFLGKDTYTVAQGDSLYSIAKEVYGDGSLSVNIFEANKDRLPDENRLSIGFVLVIPKIEKPTRTEATPSVTTPAVPSEFAGKKTYKVEVGDTLSSISEKMYGTTAKWEEIFKANKERMKSEHELKVGQLLVIPDLPGASDNSTSRDDRPATTTGESDRAPRKRDTSLFRD
ncbi:MAG: LysM peptidoglycan-binding domain-containing protein [Planctomycetota bacterium]|nr:LysM peptidoglycan-binding domain-containing protein [Planctomycetota bacterium]